MLKQAKLSRSQLLSENIDSWPQPEESLIPQKRRQIYRRRALAIRMYFRGAKHADIVAKTGIDRGEVARLISRCFIRADDGKIEGFRALIPHRKLGERRTLAFEGKRRVPGYSGAFTALLRRHPEIQTALENLILRGVRPGGRIPERKMPLSGIHIQFLKLCQLEGLTARDYPFCVVEQGYRALSTFAKKVRYQNPRRAIHQQHGKKASRKLRVGTGVVSARMPVTHPLQCIECDGHKIDWICTVVLPSPSGAGEIYVPISRLWLIVLLETFSEAVLGYSIAFGMNYSSRDVMRAIRSALQPWRPMDLSISTINYPKEGGLPFGVIPGMEYVCWDELHLDNAWAHLSEFFQEQLGRTVGCVPVFNPVYSPDSNPFVEGFFAVLEESGFHRLPATTGTGPEDSRRNDAEEEAKRYKITIDHLREIADVMIARYNCGRPVGSSLTRLEILERYVNDSRTLVRRIPLVKRDRIIYDIELKLRVAGKPSSGRRPHVVYEGARYTNIVLSSSFNLVGKYIYALGDSEDLRQLEAYFEDGSPMGTLLAEPRWRHVPHGLDTRKAINKLRRENRLQVSEEEDLPTAYRRFLEDEALKSKRKATHLAEVTIEQNSVHKVNLPEGKSPPMSRRSASIETSSPSEDPLRELGTIYRSSWKKS